MKIKILRKIHKSEKRGKKTSSDSESEAILNILNNLLISFTYFEVIIF